MQGVATILYWCVSQTVRNACAAYKHHQRQLDAQRDILSESAIAALTGKLVELHLAIRSRQAAQMREKMAELQAVAAQNLMPYAHPELRVVLDIFLVALVVALGVRTFFLQPFKIPSGSMQPTLFGVATTPDFTDAMYDLDRINFDRARFNFVRPRQFDRFKAEFDQQTQSQQTLVIPPAWQRFKNWFHGISYIHFVAPADGRIESIRPPWPGLLNVFQRIKFAGQWHILWFPPEMGDTDLAHHAGLTPGRLYHQGDDVIKLRVTTGDHLLVDRLSYNFVKPARGDVVVFGTENSQIHDPGEYYIKRLVGLPGDHVQIGDDRHLVINGQRLDSSTPHFEKVYDFDPTQPPRDSIYSGHVNGTVDRFYRISRFQTPLAPLFPDANAVFTNGPDSYLFMGDNTVNSSDSRAWGSVPTENVVGKSFLVYWPFGARFGFGN